ncbi:SIMPL domain-containing protein [Pseudidiomarina gelatinasegens]|jgi:uncharacterized protein YggE|nr:SIMPL domain-containing protein [Pseudidiomarina gelatinasegens]
MTARKMSILLIGCLTLAACQPITQEPRTLTVSSHADIEVEPDQVNINLSINREGQDLTLLKQEIDTTTAAIITFLREQQIDDRDIRSYQINASPRYDYKDGERLQRGYTATRQVSVLLRQVSNYDTIINQALEVGATHILNSEFLVSETEALYQQVLEQAVVNARAKADKMARAANSAVVDVLQIQESSQTPVRYEATMRMQQAADVSLPGTNKIRAQVQVTYQLE